MGVCKLIRESSHAGVTTLINCYNAMIEIDIELIKKHMLESMRLGGEKSDILKLAIKYVSNEALPWKTANKQSLCQSRATLSYTLRMAVQFTRIIPFEIGIFCLVSNNDYIFY